MTNFCFFLPSAARVPLAFLCRPRAQLYLVQAAVLLPWRYVRFRRTNEELLMLDFCYWVTALAAAWVVVALVRTGAAVGDAGDGYGQDRNGDHASDDEADEEDESSGGGAFARFDVAVWRALFVYANGALAWSAWLFSNKCVFHGVDYMTSTFVHLAPALCFFCLRWGSGLGPGRVGGAWPGLFRLCGVGGDGGGSGDSEGGGEGLSWWTDAGCGPAGAADLMLRPALLYLAWGVPYFCALFVCGRGCIARNGKKTLFSFLVGDPALGRGLRLLPERPATLQPLAYLGGHAVLVSALGGLSLIFWHCFAAHAAFLAALGLVVVRQVRPRGHGGGINSSVPRRRRRRWCVLRGVGSLRRARLEGPCLVSTLSSDAPTTACQLGGSLSLSLARGLPGCSATSR